MRHFLYAAICAACALIGATANDSTPAYDTLTLYTEDNPPFNYAENNEVHGASVDLLLKIFEHLNVKKSRQDIVLLPWARGYTETQRRKNTILFGTVRTKERENLFKWVVPISDGQVVLLVKSERMANLQPPLNFSSYTYGVSKASREEQVLLEAGVSRQNFLYVQSNVSALQMLARDRIDFWARDIVVVGWTMRKEQVDRRHFTVAHRFDMMPLYFALNKDTDDHIVEGLQKALNFMQENGTLSAINNRHFGTMFAASVPP